MKKAVAILATGLALGASQVHAAVTFNYIFDNGYPLAASTDGTVIAGNDLNYTSFRWTQATGFVSLGRPMQVGAGGLPGMSADGTRIAYGIGSLDGTYTTWGRWTLGSGWQELMPPMPPDGGPTDGSYGSAWGLSGNGNTVVGLYWRSGFGRAHAAKWTQATGVVDLGGVASNRSSRANGVNYDGTVITGWVETPTGPWRPAAWVNGSLVLLTDYQEVGGIPVGAGEGRATSQNGDIIIGFARDEASNQRAAAMWKRTDGVFGPVQILGFVDGSQAGGYGINLPYAVSNDGRIVVGYCSFDGSPFNTTGFVWTEETGVIDVNQWLANNGVLIDPNFSIRGLTAMTTDGTQIFGHGQMLTPPYTFKAFRITNPSTVAVPPVAAPVARVELSAPSPNPSSATTSLELSLPVATSVDVSVYDASGRRVATLLNADLPAGRRLVQWDGRESSGQPAAAGVFFAHLVTPQGKAVRRIVRMH